MRKTLELYADCAFQVQNLRLGTSQRVFFRASPEGRISDCIYTGEGCHLGGIIGIPWSGSESGLGVHVAAIRGSFAVFAAVVAAV